MEAAEDALQIVRVAWASAVRTQFRLYTGHGNAGREPGGLDPGGQAVEVVTVGVLHMTK